jgi:hypothetical protein
LNGFVLGGHYLQPIVRDIHNIVNRGKETMRKTIFGCLGTAAVAFTLQFTPAEVTAGLFDRCTPCSEVTDCDPCGEADTSSCDPCDAADCGTKGKWFVNGHLEAGFFANAHGATNDYSAGTSYGNSEILQNVRNTGGQINQVYISAGRSVDGRRGLDIGGTVDFTFGTDAYSVQSAGLEHSTGHGLAGGERGNGEWGTGDYYSAFAQAYAEIAYKKWNVKVGKFYAPFGSNGYKSTDRFFYSLAPTYAFVPGTAGGAYATYSVNDKLAVYGGWVTPDEIGESKDYNTVLGGVVWQATKRLNVHYAFASGENHYDRNALAADFDVFVNSLVTTYTRNKWKYIFDWSYIEIKPAGAGDVSRTYGLNNEVIYQYNKKWAFGVRFGTVCNYGGVDGDDWNFVSLGANWTPAKWLVVKPEVRYDYGDTKRFNSVNGGDPASTYQLSGGLSTVVKF